MKEPRDHNKAIDLINSENITLARAVPLEDYLCIVKYAKWLQDECKHLAAHTCSHIVGDDYGNAVCGLILNGIKRANEK